MKKTIKKTTPKPVKEEPVLVKPNLDELTAIHTELLKYIQGGGDVETRTALAQRLNAAIEALK